MGGGTGACPEAGAVGLTYGEVGRPSAYGDVALANGSCSDGSDVVVCVGFCSDAGASGFP